MVWGKFKKINTFVMGPFSRKILGKKQFKSVYLPGCLKCVCGSNEDLPTLTPTLLKAFEL